MMYRAISGRGARQQRVDMQPPPQEEKSLLEEFVDEVTDTADDLLP